MAGGRRVPFLAAIVFGFTFGAADQYLGNCELTLGSWAWEVSAMSAPWLLLPFVFGWTQTRPRRAMLLGLVATMAALAGYFAMMWSPVEGVSMNQFLAGWPALVSSQQMNISGGLVTGPLFGLLGQRWRVNRSWASAVLVAGAFCLEPPARWVSGRLFQSVLVWEAEVAIGIGLAVLFLVAGVIRSREGTQQTPAQT